MDKALGSFSLTISSVLVLRPTSLSAPTLEWAYTTVFTLRMLEYRAWKVPTAFVHACMFVRVLMIGRLFMCEVFLLV